MAVPMATTFVRGYGIRIDREAQRSSTGKIDFTGEPRASRMWNVCGSVPFNIRRSLLIFHRDELFKMNIRPTGEYSEGDTR